MVVNNVKFLLDTEKALLSDRVKSGAPVNDFPIHIKLFVLIFQFPNITTKSGLFLTPIVNCTTMLDKPSLEMVGNADIGFGVAVI